MGLESYYDKLNKSVLDEPKIDLFQQCNFKSHAGLDLTWKIECDAVSDAEWECFAKMISEIEVRQFSKVVGIPRGGIKLQNALSHYVSGNDTDPVLIVDDVWTTGTSFREFTEIQLIKNDIEQNGWFGWCIFARTQATDGVTALFQMPAKRTVAW